MMAKAVFGSQVKTRKQRYQAEKVSIQQALLSSMGSVLAEDPCLVGLTPNMIFQSTSLDTARAVDTSGEPLLSQQMHLSQLGASDLWNYVFQGLYSEKVKVAVIDSGVNLAHEDLREILWEDAEGVGRNFINPFASAQDDNGHGTHVAGLIAASGTNARGGSGVAPDGVEIMALKALNDDGSGNLFTIINAINWAVENGANVINLSLGGPGTNTLIRAAIEEAVKQGVFVVAAAGNDTKEISVANAFSPAMYAKDIDGFISVGSVDSDTGGISWFSNYSSTFVEVLAPGSQSASLGLLSTVGVEGFETYDRLFGTSMSAPLVAGTAALIYRVLKQNDVQPKPEVIEEYIRRFSRSDTLLRNYSVEGRTLDLKLLAQGLKGQLGSGTCP
jgi:subtilisin family serine protease